jgi:hypothetical protein
MILVDTSVWIDHFRSSNGALVRLLEGQEVLGHPVVIGELFLGGLPNRDRTLQGLMRLPSATTADHDEALQFIHRAGLTGCGINYADTHVLLSTRLTPGAGLWTRDRRLLAAARRLGLDADIEPYSGFHED